MRHPETREFRKWEGIIREAMMQQWDPLGVSELREDAEVEDEYDSYIPSIYRILREGKSVEFIFDYLRNVEEKYMGLQCNFEVTMAFSQYLFALAREISLSNNNQDFSSANEDG